MEPAVAFVQPLALLSSTSDEVIRIIPSLLWILFAAIVVAVFYRPIRDDVLPRLSALKLPGGLELTLKERIGSAAKRQQVQVSESDKTRIVRRLERLASYVHGASILWVDDVPENNADEASVLNAFGATIAFARTTAEATKMLAKGNYDLVISDVKREGREDAGTRFVVERKGVPPTILYVADYDPGRGTPPYAFAMTNSPPRLLHYVLDVLERERE